MMKNCCWSVWSNREQTIGYNTLWVQLVLPGTLLLAPLCIDGERDEVKTNKKYKPCKFVMGGDCRWDRQEIPECSDDNGHDNLEEKKSLSEVNKQKEEDVAECVTDKSRLSSSKPTTNHCQRNGRDDPQKGVQSGCSAEASGWPRDRFPMDSSQLLWWGHIGPVD